MDTVESNADPMPAKQLNAVMESSLGTNWKAEFLSFNFKPIASASIGQVHQAYSDAGDNLAVKVQYPGTLAYFLASPRKKKARYVSTKLAIG